MGRKKLVYPLGTGESVEAPMVALLLIPAPCSLHAKGTALLGLELEATRVLA